MCACAIVMLAFCTVVNGVQVGDRRMAAVHGARQAARMCMDPLFASPAPACTSRQSQEPPGLEEGHPCETLSPQGSSLGLIAQRESVRLKILRSLVRHRLRPTLTWIPSQGTSKLLPWHVGGLGSWGLRCVQVGLMQA